MALALVATGSREVWGETSMSGLVYSRLNADLRQDSPYEDNLEWRNKLFLHLKADPWDNVRGEFSLLAEHNTLAGLGTRAEYDVNLYEGFVRLRKENWDFTFGKQIVDWSRADVSVLDTLNPRDLEEFVAREDEFSKIPAVMARVYYAAGDNAYEVAYLPFYTPSRFRIYGSDWAMLNQKALGQYEGEVDVSLYTKQGFKPGVDDFPQYNGINGSVGGRWTHQGENFDYQLSYVNGWALFPLFEFNREFAEYLAAQPEGAERVLKTLTPQELIAHAPLYASRPVRQNQIGFGTSGYWGDSTVRAELTVIQPQELYTTDFTLSRHTIAAATGGIDRFFAGNLYVNLSYLGAYVGQYPEAGLFLIQRWNHYAIGVVRGDWFDGKFSPELRAMANVIEGDYVVNPRFPVRIVDNTTVTAGAYFINGREDTVFGQFRENSFGYLQLRYAF